MPGYIDLHVHSTKSDGKYSVEKIIDIAKKENISVLAFAEHYNMASYNLARKLASNDIEIIPAIEIGASLTEFNLSKRHICHMLAYYPTYAICEVLDEYEVRRNECVKKVLRKLSRTVKISYEDVVKYARNKKSIGRFDIAIALHRLGYAKSPMAAYSMFLELGQVAYVEREKLTASKLIQKIRDVKGVPVIAHPKSMKVPFDTEFNILKKLKDAGLEGIEVYNPNNTTIQRNDYMLLCNYFDLLPTCGSDFHALAERGIQIGTGINNNLCFSDYSMIENLKSRHSAIYNNNG